MSLAAAACSDPKFDTQGSADGGHTEIASNTRADAGAGANAGAEVRADAAAQGSDASSLAADATTSNSAAQDAALVPPAEHDAATQAGSDDAAAATTLSDAATETVPSWAGELIDQFAMESIFFDGSDPAVVSSTFEYLLASISKDEANGYQLTTRLCQSVWSNPGASIRAAYPERLPPRRHHLTFEADGFTTEPIDIALGYRSDPIPECKNKPGELIPVPMPRSWTSATTCRCPGPQLPPVDDCRVLDPDADNAPGFTVLAQIIPLAVSEVYGVTENRSRYLRGVPRMDAPGFVAQVAARDSSLQHSCKPVCIPLTGSTAACNAVTSRVTFVPLSKRETPAGGWDCKAVLARTGELFGPQPPTPTATACSR